MKFFEWVTEVIAWCGIVISPLLIGSIIGAVIYLNNKNVVGFILGISHVIAGLWVGIRLANKAWKSASGTVGFITRVHASPDLDDTTQNK